MRFSPERQEIPPHHTPFQEALYATISRLHITRLTTLFVLEKGMIPDLRQAQAFPSGKQRLPTVFIGADLSLMRLMRVA